MTIIRRLHRALSPLAVLALAAAPIRAASTLTSFADDYWTSVIGLSGDGRVLFGCTVVPEALPAWIQRPLAWRLVDGEWQQSTLPASDDHGTIPTGASANGSSIIGFAYDDDVIQSPLLWTWSGSAWQSASLPLPAGYGAKPEFLSADGSVAFGFAIPGETYDEQAWAWRRDSGGSWTGGLLPGGEDVHYRTALSDDGSTIAGTRVELPEVLATVWRHDGSAWVRYTLTAPDGSTRSGQVDALSADGTVAVGTVNMDGSETGWQPVVWTYSDTTDTWTGAALPGLRSSQGRAYDISADGTRIVGESHRAAKSAPTAALWTRVGDSWAVVPLSSASGFSRATAISDDGRVIFRDQSSGRSILFLSSAKNLPLPAVVALLDSRDAGTASWKFTGYHANVNAMGMDPATGEYTFVGSAAVNRTDPTGAAITSDSWAIAGFQPFLFPQITRVGDEVSVVVPDLGEGAYKVSGLPAGLRYDDATRTVSSRLTKIGLFTTVITNPSNKKKATRFTLVEPLSSTLTGTYQTLLSTDDADGRPAARLTLVAAANGTFTGTLESSDRLAPYPLRGVFAPDPDTPLQLAAFASFASTEPGLTINRVKNLDSATFTLRVNLLIDGTVTATLEKTGLGPFASSQDDGVFQTIYAGSKPENSAPWKARYTAALGAPVALGGDTRALPAGIGFATLVVDAKGKLAVSGRTADGQAFTSTTYPGADDTYRVFARPYARPDSFVGGWLRFDARGDGRHQIMPSAGGDFYWMRPAIPASKLYPDGFGPAGLTVKAEAWVKPAATVGAAAAVFGTTESTPLPLHIVGGDFDNDTGSNTYDLPQSAHFLKGLRLLPDAEAGGAAKFTIEAGTGKVSGGFTLIEADGKTRRRLSFQGVLLQTASDDPDPAILQGYFLQPALKNAASPLTVSGAISVEKPAAAP